jgi:hypothetical protein
MRRRTAGPLRPKPIERKKNRVRAVNQPITAKEQERIQTCITRNRPYGSENWLTRTANRLGLTASRRREGRPSKIKSNGKAQKN